MLFRSCRLAVFWLIHSFLLTSTIALVPNQPYSSKPLQDIVTWDQHSLFVHGDRILFYSGEFHPFRLPVPSLWLDIFQKIKALGYNGVSAYFNWVLLEGKPARYLAEGVFALEPFFETAQEAGVYILARPGPYINAEVSGGGFPGWLQRNPAKLRTNDTRYLEATDLYVASISKMIAKYQITNGGPVVLLQVENEFTPDPELPDSMYWNYVEKQYRDAGIVVPLINNDASALGYFAPGPPQRFNASVDIYGYDSYPLAYEGDPNIWPDGKLPTDGYRTHMNQSSSTPHAIIENQGGFYDPWGGPGFEILTKLLGPEYERVLYKNLYSLGVTILNMYMTYGGTNWGNLGASGVYTSYDYAAVITEDRLVDREKYSQAKVQANCLQASPAYLSAVPQDNSAANGSYTGNPAIATTEVRGNATRFFVVRHAAYNSLNTTKYSITLPTSKGNITVPQNGTKFLTLHGRDSKVYVTDYDVGGINLLYSTAEIFTWKKYPGKSSQSRKKTVLVVYTGPDEINELAIESAGAFEVLAGDGLLFKRAHGAIVIQIPSIPERRTVRFACGLTLHILDRSDAYNYWVVQSSYTQQISAPIVKAGYLMRTAKLEGSTLHLTGDINTTTTIEVVGAPHFDHLTFNGKDLPFVESNSGIFSAVVPFVTPNYTIPDLSTLEWKVLDSLPELGDYNDSLWPAADLDYSNNTIRNLTTPTSLYASDYGFHTGHILFRGQFTAIGGEKTLYIELQGGTAFAYAIWLNVTFIGSLPGTAANASWSETYTLPSLAPGESYVFTILLDTMGLEQNHDSGVDYPSTMKTPRGILDYDLDGHSSKSSISWKLTGNLHGEDYIDLTRGPLNEGGLFIERQGYHLPNAPTQTWNSTSLSAVLSTPGVWFYTTTFNLSIPLGYDIPLAISFTNYRDSAPFRAQICVNGWQFGKYVNHIGPQKVFPVPEGIWDYRGRNDVGVVVWGFGEGELRVQVELVRGMVVMSGYGKDVEAGFGMEWERREGVY